MPLSVVAAAVLAAAWLWFLARGRAAGVIKRLAFRVTLAAVGAGLVFSARRNGAFAAASLGFRIAVLAALAAALLGYLYTTRFCSACGRLVRGLRTLDCPGCSHRLPAHGMTDAPARELRPPPGAPGWKGRGTRRGPPGSV